MLEMRNNGASYQWIAKKADMTPQGVQYRLKGYAQRQSGARGNGFNIETIPYKGIYEYFASDLYLTITEFCKRAFGKENAYRAVSMRNMLMGKHDMHFTIDQVKASCKLIGKPFEYVFEKRESDDR